MASEDFFQKTLPLRQEAFCSLVRHRTKRFLNAKEYLEQLLAHSPRDCLQHAQMIKTFVDDGNFEELKRFISPSSVLFLDTAVTPSSTSTATRKIVKYVSTPTALPSYNPTDSDGIPEYVVDCLNKVYKRDPPSEAVTQMATATPVSTVTSGSTMFDPLSIKIPGQPTRSTDETFYRVNPQPLLMKDKDPMLSTSAPVPPSIGNILPKLSELDLLASGLDIPPLSGSPPLLSDIDEVIAAECSEKVPPANRPNASTVKGVNSTPAPDPNVSAKVAPKPSLSVTRIAKSKSPVVSNSNRVVVSVQTDPLSKMSDPSKQTKIQSLEGVVTNLHSAKKRIKLLKK